MNYSSLLSALGQAPMGGAARPGDFFSQGGSGLHPNMPAGPQDPTTGRTADAATQAAIQAARAAYPEFNQDDAIRMYNRDRMGASQQSAPMQPPAAAGPEGGTFGAVERLLRQQTGGGQ